MLTPQQINAAFYSAFGRNANQGEMDYWTKKTDAELKTALLNDKNAKGVYDRPWKSSTYKSEAEYIAAQKPKEETEKPTIPTTTAQPFATEIAAGTPVYGGQTGAQITGITPSQTGITGGTIHLKDPRDARLHVEVPADRQDIINILVGKGWILGETSQYLQTIDGAALNIPELKTLLQTNPIGGEASATNQPVTGLSQEDRQKQQDEYTKRAYAIIDQAVKDGRLSPEMGEFYKTVVDYYPPGIEVNPEEILNTFTKIRESTIDPHFAEITRLATTSLQQNLAYLQEQRKLGEESEQMKGKLDIEAERRRLESAGLTFSGEAVKQLGAESAYTPAQIGTQLPEGLVQQANRLLQSSSQATYQQQMKELGLSAEERLGTETLAGTYIPYYTPIGGITGTIPTAREESRATYLQNLLAQAGKKAQYEQYLPFNY